MPRAAALGGPPARLADAGSGLLRSGWLAYGLALLVGSAVVARVFPPADTLGWNAYGRAFFGDVAQHIIGQRYFIFGDWHWPLLTVPELMWPTGVNIGLTDSIPAIALVAKLARPLLPPGFHAVFLWLALSWILQPVAAVFALRSAGERRIVPAVAVAVLAISMPTLLFRAQHAALCAHFLLLLSLGLYFRIAAGGFWAAWLAGPALMLFSLLVHPYLLVMVVAVLAAAPLSMAARRDGRWRSALFAVLGGMALTAALGVLLGYGGAPPDGGYGYASMNLLSPFYPARSSLIPGFNTLLDATGKQYEGYQYLGLGLIILLALAAIGLWRWDKRDLARRHAGLLAVGLALTLFALSNRIYIGRTLLIELGEAPDWLSQFRSSGRFFWPVTYILLIAGVAIVARSFPKPIAIVGLIAAAFIQYADTRAMRLNKRILVTTRAPWVIDAERLRPLLASHARLTLWPTYGCGAQTGPDHPAFLQVLLLASEYRVRTNTMYVARSITPADCNLRQQFGSAIGEDELRVVVGPIAAEALGTIPRSKELCRRLGDLTVCAADPAELSGLPAL